MRAVFTIVLFMAVLGLVFSSLAADAPVAGVDYDIRTSQALDCEGGTGSGDSVFTRSGSTPGLEDRPADLPDRGALAVYEMMMCIVLDR